MREFDGIVFAVLGAQAPGATAPIGQPARGGALAGLRTRLELGARSGAGGE